MRSTKKQRKSRSRKGFFALFLARLVICGLISYQRVLLEREADRTQAKYEAVNARYQSELARKDELEDLEIYTQTRRFVEDMAREKFGLVYENEIIFEASSR